MKFKNLQVIMLASTQLCSIEGFRLLDACEGVLIALVMLTLEPLRTSSSIKLCHTTATVLSLLLALGLEQLQQAQPEREFPDFNPKILMLEYHITISRMGAYCGRSHEV